MASADGQEWIQRISPEVSEEQLLTALGDDFLAYVCATEPSTLRGFAEGDTSALTDPQREAFLAAIVLAQRFSLWRRPNASNDDRVPPDGQLYEPLVFSFGQFCAFTESGETSARALRRSAGGELRALPEPDADPVLSALVWLARDLWPYLLLPRDAAVSGIGLLSGAGAAAFNHPAQPALREGVRHEREPLRRLFSGLDDELAPSKSIWSTSGRGGSVQLVLLGEQLIEGAARLAGWSAVPDEEQFFAALEDQLRVVRQLARGGRVDVPATVGLTGLRLREGTELFATPVGTLREASNESWPGPRDHDSEATVALDTTFPLRYTIGDRELSADPPTKFWQSWRELDRRVDRLRLALLLADGVTRPPLRVVSIEVHDPLFRAASFRRSPGFSFPTELAVAAEADILRWAREIEAHFAEPISLAVRRTLSAADPAREPEDALVDAVIALESLFGTGETEVGFRLSTAVAFLFGRTAHERRALHKEVGDLYSVRSNLVHGKHFDDRAALDRYRRRAVELALDSLKLLLSTHHHLIPNNARGKAVILAAGELPASS